MRVLYYHQHFSTPDGATGTRSYEMALRLVEHGHDVTMVCGSCGAAKTGLKGGFKRHKRQGLVDGIEVVELELPYSNRDGFVTRSFTFLRFALRGVVVALTKEHDLVFATSTPLTAGIPGIVSSIFRRKPFVFEVRDLWPELPREMGVITNPFILKAMDLLEWVSYKTAKRCIGLSPGIVKGIQRRGIKESNVAMVPNGCDLHLFDTSKVKAVRPSGLNDDDFVALFSGAHGVANGLDAVLDAALELKKRKRKDIKLLFIGDGKLKPELVLRSKNEDLNNCIFLDPLPKKKLISILRGVDAGLMILDNVPVFYYGTSPNKFFDYIASGLPVINNYPGWLAEMISDHKCGVVVPPENPAAFADALENLADNPAEVSQMGGNARELAEQKFDRRKLGEDFVDCLESAITS